MTILKKTTYFPGMPETVAAFHTRAILERFQTLQLVDDTFLLQADSRTSSNIYIGPKCNPFLQRGRCVLFSAVFTPSPPSHHGSVWVLPVISLLLTNTISPVRTCLSMIGEVSQDPKRAWAGIFYSIQSSLVFSIWGFTRNVMTLTTTILLNIFTLSLF